MDRDTITALTVCVSVYRRLRQLGIYDDMPIKWNITGKAMKMRGLMNQISTEYDGGIEQATEHLGDVRGIRGQLGEMQDDLSAAANVMGNGSGNGSGEQVSPPVSQNIQAGVGDLNVPKPAPQSILAEHEVIQRALADTYRAQAEQQIAAGHK